MITFEFIRIFLGKRPDIFPGFSFCVESKEKNLRSDCYRFANLMMPNNCGSLSTLGHVFGVVFPTVFPSSPFEDCGLVGEEFIITFSDFFV